MPFRWTAQRLDYEFSGEWDWHLGAPESHGVLDFLEQMQALTWGEIESHTYNGRQQKRFRKHHSMSVDKLCSDAQERLVERFQGEELPDEVFRFRLNSLTRLWGRRSGGRFEIIWFDRNHRVYPVDD